MVSCRSSILLRAVRTLTFVGSCILGLNSYKNSSLYVSSGRVKNFYVTEPIGDKAFTGPDAILMPAENALSTEREAGRSEIAECLRMSQTVRNVKCSKGVDIKQCK